MTCFITLTQLVLYEIITGRLGPLDVIVPKLEHRQLFKTFLILCGVWNLDFIHYSVPPFCVSSSLRQKYVPLYGYTSAFYPFFLILLIWVCVEMYDCNIRPLAWLRTLNHSCSVGVRGSRNWDIRKGIINCFTSFFCCHIPRSYISPFYYYSLLLYTSYMTM